METVMLIEIWERLRGYDKWVETEAKMESSEVRKTITTTRYGQIATYDAGDLLTWVDAQDEKHYSSFSVDDESPLYQFVNGESLTIRYDPADADHFYNRDLLRTRIRAAVRITLITLAVAALIIARIWTHLH